MWGGPRQYSTYGAHVKTNKIMPLDTAIRDHVLANDSIHLMVGHTRWTAAARELVRQWWGRDPQFELIMLSLSSLGALFFKGELVRHVVTGYSGDTFPNFTPNPWFQRAYRDGTVTVEHWSFLAFVQRREAAAKGLPAIATRSISGSSMEHNEAFSMVDTPFGAVGMLAPLQPDVALVHAPVADRDGNIAFHPPMLEGVWGALAARRGVIATVERVVDDLRPWSHFVRIPAHRVLAVSEVPMGAHPGGLYAGDLPVEGYVRTTNFGSRRVPRPAVIATTNGFAHGCSTSIRRKRGSNDWVANGSRCCVPRPILNRGALTRQPSSPISMRQQTPGSAPR